MDLNLIPLAARFESRGIQFARIARTEREQVRREVEAFGMLDNRGREIGYMYTIDREFWVIDADSRTIVRVEDVDDHLEETFLVEPHGMRDGKCFGPLPVASYKRFRTLDEARAYGAKCIDRAYQRAIKKASA